MATDFNSVTLIGRLTADPVSKYLPSGSAVVEFSIANNRFYYMNGTLQKEVFFFDLVTWGYTADKAAVSLFKGRHVLVNGELRQNVYTAKDGTKKSSVYILALDIKNLDKKSIGNTSYTKTANNQIVSDFIEENLEEVF